MTDTSEAGTGRSSSAGTQSGADEKTDRRLKQAYFAAQSEYGPIPLPFEHFAGQVLERMIRRLTRCNVAPSPDRLDHLLAVAPLTDLFLAIACDEDAPGAWEVFTERFVPRLIGLARHRGYPHREAVQAAESMPGELVFRPGLGKNRSRLGTYEGAGRLFDWLAVIFMRRLQGLSRDTGLPRGARKLSIDAQTGSHGQSLAEDVPSPSAESNEPVVQMIEQETGERFADALRDGWQELTTSESLALLYKYEQRLHQKEIAQLLGLSESRISRIVHKALEKIREHVLRSVPEAPSSDLNRPGRFWPALQAIVSRHLERSSSSANPRTVEP
jgi:RNA polymerase sigma factor (sigma-70 family)